MTDKQLDNVACSCLLACALCDFAKKRARAMRHKAVLGFFAEGRDRFLLDELHREHLPLLKRYEEKKLTMAALGILRARYTAERGRGEAAWWDGLARLFMKEYSCGRVNLFEVDWE